MKKIDWNRLVPLGMDGKRVRDGLLLAWGIGAGWSLRFLVQYLDAREKLFVWRHPDRFLIPGAKIVPFSGLLEGCFLLLAIVAANMLPLAIGFYYYHYQGCRSIYTMKRLPRRWELWRRCLVMPVVAAVACGLTVPLLCGLYYLVYLLCTPAGCLP